MNNEEIKKLIENRENTHYGIYSDIGNVLEKIDTTDLCRYFVEVTMNGNDSCLRNYIEQQIIANEIDKLRYEKNYEIGLYYDGVYRIVSLKAGSEELAKHKVEELIDTAKEYKIMHVKEK